MPRHTSRPDEHLLPNSLIPPADDVGEERESALGYDLFTAASIRSRNPLTLALALCKAARRCGATARPSSPSLKTEQSR